MGLNSVNAPWSCSFASNHGKTVQAAYPEHPTHKAFNMNKFKYFLYSGAVFTLLFSGCAPLDPWFVNDRRPASPDVDFPDPGNSERVEIREVERLPWETWPLGRTLNGVPFKTVALIKGDELAREGRRAEALMQYLSVPLKSLSPEERESAVLRIGAMQLAEDRARSALTTLSNYFQGSGASVGTVPEPFSLLFAFSYGRVGDVDQALAWFSKLNRSVAGQGGMAQASESGTKLFLRSLPEESLLQQSSVWKTDSFISRLLAEEARRRASGEDMDGLPTWQRRGGDGGKVVAGILDPVRVGVLLPLTGKFAPLGQSVKRGIQLALDPSLVGPNVQLTFLDTKGEGAYAVALVREFAANEVPGILIGPLLSGPAVEASEAAKLYRVPIIAMSKKAYFPTGEGIFRLGATPQSQVKSLLDAASLKLGLERIALVYPRSYNGQAFAEEFRRYVHERNMTISYEASYEPGNSSAFVGMGSELERSGSQAVFLPDNLEAASSFMLANSMSNKSPIRLLGTASWDSPPDLNRMGRALAGIIFVSPFFQQSKDASILEFNTSFRSRFGNVPDFLAAQGFDAASIARFAIEGAASSKVSLTEGVRKLGMYQGITGNVSVQWNGELAREFAVVELQPDGVVPVKKPETPMFIARGNDVR